MHSCSFTIVVSNTYHNMLRILIFTVLESRFIAYHISYFTYPLTCMMPVRKAVVVCVHFTAGATSNLVTLQVGNIEEDYKATLVLRITDVFGDYTDIEYNVKVSKNVCSMKYAWCSVSTG